MRRQGVSGDINAGGVSVLYGKRGGGLRAVSNQFWTQDTPGIKGRAEPDDRLGHALATGDFDGGGAFDLAIGVPGDSVAGFVDAGAVNVLYGTAGGVRAFADELWTQATSGVKGAVGNDRFGSAAAGWRLTCRPRPASTPGTLRVPTLPWGSEIRALTFRRGSGSG